MRAFSSPRPLWHSVFAPIVAVIAFFAVQGDSYMVYLAITTATAYILATSFNLLYGYSGIFSLAHVAVYGVGAYATCLYEMRWGLPFVPATLLAMVTCGLLGVVLWWPTRRLRDLFLAIATLGFAVTVQELMLKWTSLTGGATGLLGVPDAALGIDLPPDSYGYFWLVAMCAVIAWEVSARMTSSGLGRKLVALRDAPISLGAVGVSAGRVRLVVYVVSAMLAALAGSLFAHESLFISSESFGLDRLILLILAVLFGGAGTMLGPVLGVIVLVFVDEIGVSSGGSNSLILGIAVIVFLGYLRGGLIGVVSALAVRLGVRWRRPATLAPTPELAGEAGNLLLAPVAAGPALVVDHVSVRFGGVHAMSDVSLRVEPGKVLGLIGPNGAGKTTLVNVITGYVRPTEGRVLLGEETVSGRHPDLVVASGVVRTFQTARLIPGVSVVGNVALGFARQRAATDVEEILDLPRARRDSRTALRRAEELLAVLGVRAGQGLVRNQPYATQRLTEIARAVACGPRYVLLDEPGAGLNEHERSVLAGVIRKLAEAGIGVVLIDHNVSFVSGVSDAIHVLDGGRTLASGDPEAVMDRPDVVAAYLGGAA